MKTRHPPGQPDARRPGLAIQGTGIKTGEATSSEKTRTACAKYTPLLPLMPATLSDAWSEEVVQSLQVHRALRRLMAALADCEVRPW
jgi:hypothetical protein